jgi:hypothetical protein
MFTEILNFKFMRSWRQAIGWYLTFLLIGILISAIFGALFDSATGSIAERFSTGTQIGSKLIILYELVLALLIARGKGYSALTIILGLLGALLAAFGGGVLGLLPLAYLTTIKAAGGDKADLETVQL